MRILILLLLIIPLVCKSQTILEKQDKFMGILQTSGLLDNDKTKLNIDSDFQLVGEEGCNYIVSDSDLLEFWGQCVVITGKILEGWENNPLEINGHTTFGRSTIKAFDIRSLDYDSINCEKIRLSYSCMSRDTVICRIERMKRMAPDINYDYKIIPEQPLKILFEEMEYQQYFPLIHNLKPQEINSIINTKRTYKLCGDFTGGYAEFVVFKLGKIIE